jgi:hypothetical protein
MTLPTKPDQRHVTQATHNECLLNEACFPDPCTQKNINYKDWTATIAFYAALHYIQAYLHVKGLRTSFRNHRDRNDYLKNFVSVRDRTVSGILPKYIGLFKLSRLVRYRPCSYHYVSLNYLCSNLKFALEDLPRALKLSS